MTWYNFKWNGRDLRINDSLRRALDSAIYNIKYNPQGKWDIMILVSGDRRTGTGKSTMTQLMAAYCSSRTGVPYTINDIYFDSKQMLDEAIKKPDNSINHYDEARRGLATSKRMSRIQEDLLDYYAECRQLHHINFIVLPDFFKLNEEIAVARSEFLVNVVRERKEIMSDLVTGTKEPTTKWTRGTFHFYRWESKKILFDIYTNTRKKDYWAFSPDFHGNFEDLEIINKEEYEGVKRKALEKYQQEKKGSVKELRFKTQRDQLIDFAVSLGAKNKEIAEFLEVSERNISLIRRTTMENDGNELENEV